MGVEFLIPPLSRLFRRFDRGVHQTLTKSLVLTGKPGTYHLMSNFEIVVHGDTATAWSRWTFIIPNADKKPSFSSGGHYEDSLVRENGHWKFKRRVAINNIPH